MLYIIVITVFFLFFLLFFFFFLKKKDFSPQTHNAGPPKINNCPLCGSILEGTKLFAKMIEYPDGSLILNIYGCGSCYKGKRALTRICPSCKKRMEEKDFLRASYKKTNEKTVVLIKGCASCHFR
jgi:hypothetical protein